MHARTCGFSTMVALKRTHPEPAGGALHYTWTSGFPTEEVWVLKPVLNPVLHKPGFLNCFDSGFETSLGAWGGFGGWGGWDGAWGFEEQHVPTTRGRKRTLPFPKPCRYTASSKKYFWKSLMEMHARTYGFSTTVALKRTHPKPAGGALHNT